MFVRNFFRLLSPIAAAAVLTLTACGGGGGSSSGPGGPTPIGPGPSPSPSPSSSPTPTGPAVSAAPNSLSFTAVGPGAPGQTVSVAQANNTTGFTLSTTNCSGIVSVSGTTGAGPFTFEPLAAGTCSYLVTGAGRATTTISITVTTTSVGSS